MSTDHIRVLHLEGNPSNAPLVQQMLAESPNVTFDLRHSPTSPKLLEVVAEDNPDVVLMDLSSARTPRLDILTKVHSFVPQVPVLIMTGQMDENLAIEAIEHGAEDLLVKERLDSDLLSRSIREAV